MRLTDASNCAEAISISDTARECGNSANTSENDVNPIRILLNSINFDHSASLSANLTVDGEGLPVECRAGLSTSGTRCTDEAAGQCRIREVRTGQIADKIAAGY